MFIRLFTCLSAFGLQRYKAFFSSTNFVGDIFIQRSISPNRSSDRQVRHSCRLRCFPPGFDDRFGVIIAQSLSSPYRRFGMMWHGGCLIFLVSMSEICQLRICNFSLLSFKIGYTINYIWSSNKIVKKEEKRQRFELSETFSHTTRIKAICE